MMKINKLAKTLIVVAMVCLLAACGKHSMSLELLEEASGVKVTAENAGKDDVVTSEGAITVEDGDVIVISPFLDKAASSSPSPTPTTALWSTTTLPRARSSSRSTPCRVPTPSR